MEETNLQKVVDILKEKGSSDEQIAQFLADLTKASFSKLYADGVAVFTETDLKLIESCKDQTAANNVIRQKYLERTGITAEAANKKFLDDFCTGFLKEAKIPDQ